MRTGRPRVIAPIPAATLIAMRDRPGAAPELLMLRRHAALAFAADAWVFPGGRLEADDAVLAAGSGVAGDADDLAARVAAIRETIEEAGLAVAIDPVPDAAGVARLRDGLAAGRSFGALLAAGGFALRLDRLVPWARWQPPAHVARRFDTRFYLAPVTADAPISADGGESVDICWTAAATMIARWRAGEAKMLLPTRANLERLLPHPDYASAAREAAALPVRLLCPAIAIDDGVAVVTVPPGYGYPPISHIERG